MSEYKERYTDEVIFRKKESLQETILAKAAEQASQRNSYIPLDDNPKNICSTKRRVCGKRRGQITKICPYSCGGRKDTVEKFKKERVFNSFMENLSGLVQQEKGDITW
jgi:hypothetical protein